MEDIQIDYINYRNLLKNNYSKGVHSLRSILLSEEQALAFTSNKAAVSVVVDFDTSNPDMNAISLYDMLFESSVLDNAILTYCDAKSINEFGTSDKIIDKMFSLSKNALEMIFNSPRIINVLYLSPLAISSIWENNDALQKFRDKTDVWNIIGNPNEQVTGKTICILSDVNPDDYEDFNAVMDSYIVVSAAWVSGISMQFIKDRNEIWNRFKNPSSQVIGKAACALSSIDPSEYEDIVAVAASETAMNAVAASETAMNAVINSETAMNAVAASETAMNAVAASETAMNAVINSETAMNAVINSETAMNAVINSETAMNAVAASETAMNAVINSETAMNAVAASETALVYILKNISKLSANAIKNYLIGLNRTNDVIRKAANIIVNSQEFKLSGATQQDGVSSLNSHFIDNTYTTCCLGSYNNSSSGRKTNLVYQGTIITTKYEFGSPSSSMAQDPTKINAIGVVGCTLTETGDGYASVAKYTLQ